MEEIMSENAGRQLSRRTILGGSVALGGVLLTGCDAGTTSGKAVKTLRVGVPTDVNLARPQGFLSENQPLRRTVFDYLIDKHPDGTYMPALATDWEFSSDGRTLVLTLRDGVEFHTGRTFGPDDVIGSVQTALDPAASVQVATILNRASDMRKTGKSEVTVTFDEPFPVYLDALSALPIIDPETFSDMQDGTQVIGTGPFKWVTWTAGVKFMMKRNESYWQKGKPSLEELDFSIISESQAMLTAFRAGELDLVARMVARDAARLRKEGDFNVTTTAAGVEVYVGVDVDTEPFRDVRVRQAVAYALDRKRIADQVYLGFAEPTAVPWPSDTPGTTEDQINRYAYDVDQGSELLKAAGAFEAEVGLTWFPGDPTYGAAAEIVQFGLEQIGLKVKPVPMDTPEFVDHLINKNMPGLWVSPTATTTLGVPAGILTAFPFRPDDNTHHFTPPEYGRLVNEVVAAAPDKQAGPINELTEFMLDNAFHNTFVQAKQPVVGAAGLKGVRTDLTEAFILTNATLTK
jgi:peptide/nickel transport system substrate-binding protein